MSFLFDSKCPQTEQKTWAEQSDSISSIDSKWLWIFTVHIYFVLFGHNVYLHKACEKGTKKAGGKYYM